jgi:hypothetical protein
MRVWLPILIAVFGYGMIIFAIVYMHRRRTKDLKNVFYAIRRRKRTIHLNK